MLKSRILIVDDEDIMRCSLSDWLKEDGYDAVAVENGYKALELLKNENFDLAIVDLKMPEMDGIEVLKKINEGNFKIPVVIITAYATIDSAVVAMKEGAADYVVKPFNPEEISIVIKKLIGHQQLIKENIRLRKELTKKFKFQDLIGKSPEMLKVFEMVKTVAPTKSTILIRGESGTGKELVARAIHELCPRKHGPFIPVACGAMPESLLEAELFGYEKGAFTGAIAQYKGRIELAHKGTLFLDEIGDISAKTQVDLLRFIQEREFRRLGGKEILKVDVRLIAATNKNLEEMVKNNTFREDLYYRLNVITIEIPPLRDRKMDIPLLVEHFLDVVRLKTGKEVTKISSAAMELLMEYDWPGNVRELENVIEHSIVVSKGNEIQINDLPQYLLKIKKDVGLLPTNYSLEQMEEEHILNVLNANDWNIKKSAEILKINRLTLYKKIKKYNLKRSKV
ncbi:MAG: sigma-54-dependent transcriptional regulator [bacterium]